MLECAVGAALGEAPDPADSQRTDLDPSLASEGSTVPPDDRYRCRLMYTYRETWEPELEKRGRSRGLSPTWFVLVFLAAEGQNENQKSGAAES